MAFVQWVPAEEMPHSYFFLDLTSVSTILNIHHVQILAVACAVLGIIGLVFAFALQGPKDTSDYPSLVRSFGTFFYASFLKPHTGDSSGTGQQAALESFYKAQVVFDYHYLSYRADIVDLNRLTYTMRLVRDFFGVERTCWVLWQHS